MIKAGFLGVPWGQGGRLNLCLSHPPSAMEEGHQQGRRSRDEEPDLDITALWPMAIKVLVEFWAL